jgi:hypothetical protein
MVLSKLQVYAEKKFNDFSTAKIVILKVPQSNITTFLEEGYVIAE